MDRLLDLRRLIYLRRLVTTTRRRASHGRLLNFRRLRLIFVAAGDKDKHLGLLDLGLLGLLSLLGLPDLLGLLRVLPLRFGGLHGGVVVVGKLFLTNRTVHRVVGAWQVLGGKPLSDLELL